MPSHNLLIATTPLTVLVGAAVARTEGGRWRLAIIEDFADAAAWEALLADWRGNPFEAIERLPGRATEARAAAGITARGIARRVATERSKRRLRQQAFARLAAIDASYAPGAVVVGNDRRPETQYALALAQRRGTPRPGVYLDDGLFSYVGDVHARPLARRLLDTPLKKLAWGRWWRSVDIAGTSPWIDRAWLALPEAALDRDPRRTRMPLPREAFADRAMARLALAAWRRFGSDARAPRFDAMIALPHSDLIAGDPAARAAIGAQLARLAGPGRALAIKHHPRELHPDPLGLAATGARLLPAGIAFELLLPLLRRGALVAGTASTALLAARWLRPDLAVHDLGGVDGVFARRAADFLAAQGVT
jgi:hypothetical protein